MQEEVSEIIFKIKKNSCLNLIEMHTLNVYRFLACPAFLNKNKEEPFPQGNSLVNSTFYFSCVQHFPITPKAKLYYKINKLRKWQKTARRGASRDRGKKLPQAFLGCSFLFDSPIFSKLFLLLSKWMKRLIAFPSCCYLSRWVVSPLGRGHVYTLQTFQKYLHYKWRPIPVHKPDPPEEKCRVCKNQPASSTCAQVKLFILMPDHKGQSAQKLPGNWAALRWPWVSVALETIAMCWNQLGGCVSAGGWPCQREGQGQEAPGETFLCGILIWENMFTH